MSNPQLKGLNFFPCICTAKARTPEQGLRDRLPGSLGGMERG
jgi:hypothetical protein